MKYKGKRTKRGYQKIRGRDQKAWAGRHSARARVRLEYDLSTSPDLAPRLASSRRQPAPSPTASTHALPCPALLKPAILYASTKTAISHYM